MITKGDPHNIAFKDIKPEYNLAKALLFRLVYEWLTFRLEAL